MEYLQKKSQELFSSTLSILFKSSSPAYKSTLLTVNSLHSDIKQQTNKLCLSVYIIVHYNLKKLGRIVDGRLNKDTN